MISRGLVREQSSSLSLALVDAFFAFRGVGEGGSVPEIVTRLRQVAALRKVPSVPRCTGVRDLDVVPRSKAKANG